MGVPIGVCIAGANRNDFKLTTATIESMPVKRPSAQHGRQNLCLDKGFDYLEVYRLVKRRRYEGHISQRSNSPVERKRTPGRRKPRRWPVERTHSWMNRYRRMLIRWEKRDDNYLGLVHFVCGIIAFRAAGVYG